MSIGTIALLIASFFISSADGKVNSNLSADLLVIPTQAIDKWQIEQYSGIPKNEFSFSSKGILVQVKKSASPLMYPLEKVTKISGFKIKGEFLGLPKFKNLLSQGSKGADDYVLRIGFVVPGDKKLNGFKKMFAAEWVKRLYARVPPGMGLGYIQFFNITQNADQVGSRRTHPLSDLIQEEFFASVSDHGPFEYSYEFKEPIEAVALWVSVDGDDTKSDYDVLVSGISLKVP